MNRRFLMTPLLVAALLHTMSASAEGFYVGVEGGHGRTQLAMADDGFIALRGELVDATSDREDVTLGLYGGYAFSQHFALELSLADFGESSYTTLRDVPIPFPSAGFGVPVPSVVNIVPEQQRMTFESQALTAALIGRYEFTEDFAATARVGLSVHRIESDVDLWLNGQRARVVGSKRDTSAGAGVLGVGAEWRFHPSWAARLHAQRHFLLEDEQIYLIDRGDVTTLAAGIEYRF